MSFAPFDVVLVAFPFSERTGRKQRPGLVVSPETFGKVHAHSLVAMITTAANTVWPSDLAIADVAEAGLRVPCVLRAKLVTLSDEVIIGRLGRLTPRDEVAARGWLHGLIA